MSNEIYLLFTDFVKYIHDKLATSSYAHIWEFQRTYGFCVTEWEGIELKWFYIWFYYV